jgi:hypothetical protein
MQTKLNETIQLGDPIEHQGIAIAPLFPRREPVAQYLTLEEAIPLGLVVREVDAAGSVPELLVMNPLEADVLLYDGEELIGAKQNRILNVTVLVPAQSETPIPVSCVEEGRWSARSASFATARHVSYPDLRRRKAEALSVDPLALGLAQGEVWDEMRSKVERLEASAPTGAQADVFRSQDRDLAGLRSAFPLLPGQCGALLALGPNRLVLDYVSRPDAFVRLYPKLLEGYLLDGLEHLGAEPTAAETLESFVERAEEAPRSRRSSAGLGDDLRLRGDDVIGSGLAVESELVQLCVFSTRQPNSRAWSRVTRPSRRG